MRPETQANCSPLPWRPSAAAASLLVRELGICDYQTTVASMQAFTKKRNQDTQDEVWLLQHHRVFTRGVSCCQQPSHRDCPIPVVDSDRGGQITYHAPGQLVAYFLFDLRRRRLGIRQFVSLLETLLVEVLGSYGIEAVCRTGAPGVYVGQAKIAALGFRVHRGCCYHGISLNVDLDLSPFDWIDPCGYAGLAVTSVAKQGVEASLAAVQTSFLDQLQLSFV